MGEDLFEGMLEGLDEATLARVCYRVPSTGEGSVGGRRAVTVGDLLAEIERLRELAGRAE